MFATGHEQFLPVLTLLAALPHESRAAGALPAGVVTVCSVLTLAYRCTVLPVKPQGTPCKTRSGRERSGTTALEIQYRYSGWVCYRGVISLAQLLNVEFYKQRIKIYLILSGLKYTLGQNYIKKRLGNSVDSGCSELGSRKGSSKQWV